MNSIFSEKVISLRELALIAFALVLLAATPGTKMVSEPAGQQPVNAVVPATEEPTETKLKEA